MLIQLPPNLDFRTVLPVIAKLDAADFLFTEDKLEIDFGPLGFAKPSGTLLLGIKIKEIMQENKGLPVFGLNVNPSVAVHSYLSHTGFFKYVGFDLGNAPGQASGSATYVPIKDLDFDMVRNQVELPYRTYLEVIQNEAGKLAHLFTYGETQYQRFLSYIFREVIRNSFEHSRANCTTFYGQYWRNGAVELVLYDAGIGIATNIRQKYGAKLSVVDCIDMATKPGISGQDLTIEGSRNSGFGLYILKQLAHKYGRITIISNRHGITYNPAGFSPTSFETNLPGTFIIIRMRVENSEEDYEKLVRDFVKEGEAEALREGRVAKASFSSSVFLT